MLLFNKMGLYDTHFFHSKEYFNLRNLKLEYSLLHILLNFKKKIKEKKKAILVYYLIINI